MNTTALFGTRAVGQRPPCRGGGCTMSDGRTTCLSLTQTRCSLNMTSSYIHMKRVNRSVTRALGLNGRGQSASFGAFGSRTSKAPRRSSVQVFALFEQFTERSIKSIIFAQGFCRDMGCSEVGPRLGQYSCFFHFL